MFYYAVAPCQLEPIPAVQPKQWLSLRIFVSSNSSNDSISKTVLQSPSLLCILSAPISYPNCWLKSQSYICVLILLLLLYAVEWSGEEEEEEKNRDDGGEEREGQVSRKCETYHVRFD